MESPFMLDDIDDVMLELNIKDMERRLTEMLMDEPTKEVKPVEHKKEEKKPAVYIPRRVLYHWKTNLSHPQGLLPLPPVAPRTRLTPRRRRLNCQRPPLTLPPIEPSK